MSVKGYAPTSKVKVVVEYENEIGRTSLDGLPPDSDDDDQPGTGGDSGDDDDQPDTGGDSGDDGDQPDAGDDCDWDGADNNTAILQAIESLRLEMIQKISALSLANSSTDSKVQQIYEEVYLGKSDTDQKLSNLQTTINSNLLQLSETVDETNAVCEDLSGNDIVWSGISSQGGDFDRELIEMNYYDAFEYCENMNTKDHDNWRLPTRWEYQDLLGGCENHLLNGFTQGNCNNCKDSFKCNHLFPNESGRKYWMHSENATETNRIAWSTRFNNNDDEPTYLGLNRADLMAHVRCVREK